MILLVIVTFPFYVTAYAISHVLRLPDYDNMPDPAEWFDFG